MHWVISRGISAVKSETPQPGWGVRVIGLAKLRSTWSESGKSTTPAPWLRREGGEVDLVRSVTAAR
jgi:hypothetical protein